jgi:hypothetical protein
MLLICFGTQTQMFLKGELPRNVVVLYVNATMKNFSVQE